jgi:YD repeat-containing protein
VAGVLALCAMGAALAADETPEEFLNSLATLDARYLPAGSAGTGEAVDLYTGSLGFVVTDVSLPGNSDLTVSLTRRFSVGSLYHSTETYPFGDWQLEAPVITGVVSHETWEGQDGWRSGPNRTQLTWNRCSDLDDIPTIETETSHVLFTPKEYTDGFHLKVPGAGSQRLLSRDASNGHVPSTAIEGYSQFPVVMKNDWVAACLPSLKNGQPGEGFLVVAPDGRRFWFDWLVYRTVEDVLKPVDGGLPASEEASEEASPQAENVADLPRERVYLYATKVKDRFGHEVDYTYDGNGHLTDIEADDGRHLQMYWTGNLIDQVTAQPTSAHPRVWHYGYDVATASLTGVTLPDATHWSYAGFSPVVHAGVSSLLSGDCVSTSATPTAPHTATGSTLGASVTTPGGLKVTYTVGLTARGHADTPIGCEYYHTSDHPGLPSYPQTYYLWSLKTKVASGAGLAGRTWSYSYSEPNGSWSTQCTPTCPKDTVWTKITDPEGRITQYTYSNVFDETEGQLRQVQWSGGGTTRTQTLNYVDGDVGPWPADYGDSAIIRSNVRLESMQTPLASRLTTEGGISYAWTASSFDTYTAPLTITRSSSGINGQSVSETLAYENNTAVWVLGQFKSRTVTAPATYAGKVPESRTYNADDATMKTISRFEHPVASYTWYPTGNAAAGRLWQYADGLNHVTQYGNYQYGIPKTIEYADATGIGLGVNDFGEVLSVSDELNHVTSVTRDDLGRMVHKTFPADAGNAWAPVNVSYQSTSTSEYGVTGTHWKVTATQGNRTDVMIYDAALDPVLTSLRDTSTGQGTMTWRTFDSTGATTFASYPLNYSASLPGTHPGVATFHDALGRVTKTQADSKLGLLTTTAQYVSGSEVKVTNPKNHVTQTVYQAFDVPDTMNPLRITFADGTKTTITRDPWSNPTTVIESGTYTGAPISVTHGFVYDDRRRLCIQTDPESGQTVYGYDEADNLAWSAQGQSGWGTTCPLKAAISTSARIDRTHDLRNRLLTINYPTGTDDSGFTYYGDGRVKTATRGGAVWTNTYFNRGALKSESLAIDGKTFALGYTYDTLGQLKTQTYPSSRQVDYAPDALGRPTQVGSYADALDYAPGGLLTGMTYGNGVEYVASANTRTLLSSESYGLSGNVLSARTLAWDGNGNLDSITDSVVADTGCEGGDGIFCADFECGSADSIFCS